MLPLSRADFDDLEAHFTSGCDLYPGVVEDDPVALDAYVRHMREAHGMVVRLVGGDEHLEPEEVQTCAASAGTSRSGWPIRPRCGPSTASCRPRAGRRRLPGQPACSNTTGRPVRDASAPASSTAARSSPPPSAAAPAATPITDPVAAAPWRTSLRSGAGLVGPQARGASSTSTASGCSTLDGAGPWVASGAPWS